MNKFLYALLALIALAIFTNPIYSAITGENLINVQDSTATTYIKGVRVKDAGNIGDNITSGLASMGALWYDGTNWDKARGDATNGLDVDVTRVTGSVTMVGNNTPADNYTTPTDALDVGSFLMLYDGTTWDMARNTTHADNVSTSIGLNTASIGYLYDGSTYDRWYSGINVGQALVDGTSNGASNIITNATTAVKATGGILNRVYVNTAGTTSTAALYNIASAGCTGTPGSGYVATVTTTTANNGIEFNHTFTLGICVVTAGAAAANISVLYR